MSPWTPTVLQCTTRRDARLVCRLDDVPTAVALTARYSHRGQARLPVERGDVVDDLDARAARDSARHGREIADRQLDARRLQDRRAPASRTSARTS